MPCYTQWDAYLGKGSPEYAEKKSELEAKLRAVRHIVDYYYGVAGLHVPPAEHSGRQRFIELAEHAFQIDATCLSGIDEQPLIERIAHHCTCDGIEFTLLYDLVSLLDIRDPGEAGYARALLLCANEMRGNKGTYRVVDSLTSPESEANRATAGVKSGDSPGRRSRFRGALLGLAAGDALGTTLEFREPGSFAPLTDMVGGGPFGLTPGQWTDDTAMALCLAESLIECRGFDAADQMRRYLRWWREGHRSCTGRCFDIGNTVSAALARFERTGEPFAGDPDPRFGGNGSLMRLAPVPLAYAGLPEEAIRLAGEMSRTTHPAPEPVDACRYYAGLLVGALAGVPKAVLLGPRFHPAAGAWPEGALSPAVARIAEGSFRTRRPPAVRGSGYVVHALEAALWAFHSTDDFEAGALAAVNLGEDADTTGAIYGQLAGACYGANAIPAPWRARLAMAGDIEALADALRGLSLELADARGPTGPAPSA